MDIAPFLEEYLMKLLFVFTVLMFLFSDTVYAYLDPGIGTMLIQLLAGVALFIGIGWRFIIRFFKKLFNKDKGR